MERTKIENSKLIQRIGYDAATKALEVELLNGRTYLYYPVEPERYQALMHAASRGGHFLKYIKSDPEVHCRRMEETSREEEKAEEATPPESES